MCSVTGTKPPSRLFNCQEKQPSPTTQKEKEEEKERNRQGGMEREEGGKGQMERNRSRRTKKGVQRERKGNQCEVDKLQSAWRSRLAGRRNWTAPMAMMMLCADWR